MSAVDFADLFAGLEGLEDLVPGVEQEPAPPALSQDVRYECCAPGCKSPRAKYGGGWESTVAHRQHSPQQVVDFFLPQPNLRAGDPPFSSLTPSHANHSGAVGVQRAAG